MEVRSFIKKFLVFGLLSTASIQARGQTNAIATGNWSDPLTWSAGEPTTTLPATINGARTVTIDQSGETTNLLNVGSVSGQTGGLTISDGTLLIDDPDTSTEPNTPGLLLGVGGGIGTLTMAGGAVVVSGTVGSDIFTPAGGAGPVNPNGEAIIGLEGGTGTMNQSGGTFQTADEAFVGFRANSTGTLNVSAGTFETLGRSLLPGFQGGTGNINVSGTGVVRANFDILAAFGEGGAATISLAGSGTIECGFLFTNFATDGAGSTTTINMTGGTLNSRLAIVLGQGAGTTTMTHSAGTVNVLTNNGDFVVSDSIDPGHANTSTYNISGTAQVNLLHNMILGAFAEANGTVNQTGGTITAGDNVFVGRDNIGVWNISAGLVQTTNFDFVLGNFSDASTGTVNQTGGTVKAGVNVVVARDGTGNYNLSSGAVQAQSIFLGDFDTSYGTMKIAGGTVTLTGNLNVGGALASNAAPDRVEPTGSNGAQGQALAAHGKLIVSGNSATINVGGNFLANPSDKSTFRSDPFAPGGNNTADLVFEIFNNAGTSLINTTGVADLDGSVIDIDLMSGFTPALNATFDLLKASSFGTTGSGTTQNVGTGVGYTLAAEDTGVFSLAIVPAAGGGQVLRATFLGGALGVQGDYNGNGVVDAADYVLWRNGGPLQNDPTAGVQPTDYNFWRSRFGATSGGGSGSASAVPEPATWLLLVVGVGLGWCRAKTGGRPYRD